MYKFIPAYKQSVFFRHRKALLLFCWGVGFLLGCYIGFQVSTPLILLMRTSFSERVSIVQVLIANLLPVFVLAMALLLKLPFLHFPICFFKAYTYGLSLVCIYLAFKSAAWLIYLLLFFSVFADGVIFVRFALRHEEWKGRNTMRDLIVAATVLITLVCFHYFAVSPFSVMLLN